MKKQHTSILILCCFLMIGCGSIGQTADNDKAIEEQTQQAQDDSINQASEPDQENEPDVSTDVDEADEQQPEDATQSDEAKKTQQAAPTDVYSDLLALYKKAQEGAYSQEQVEEIGLQTELLQDAWPWATSEDAVKYLFFDVDSDGKEELIITYYGEIKDIYGSDGKSHVYAYGCPYRGIASLYSNGMVEELMAATMQSASTTWYRYDPETGRYFPVFGTHYIPGKNEAEDATYFTYAYDEKRDEAKESCKETGEVPAWVWDHARELTEEEYNAMCPELDPVKLPEGKLLSEFE